MAALPLTYPTISDVIKRRGPDGQISTEIVEALQERNPILQDAPYMEGNLPTGHRVVIRSGLPAVGWRMFNQGTDASKSTTIQVDESTGELVGRSEVDVSLAKLNGDEAAFRRSEDMAFLQAMNNEVATTLFYGSTKTDPEKFHGLSPRYDALTGATNSSHVIDPGITAAGAEQSSIWFITWGPETCFLIYPKGSSAGLSMEDLGKDYVDDRQGTPKKFLAWRTHFMWQVGLVIKDWRYVVRIPNIDSSAYSATGTQLITAMIDAYNTVYDLNVGRTIIYMNRTAQGFVDKQIINKSNVYFTPGEWHGRTVNMFRGIPIVTCDALIATEAVVA